VEKNDRNRAIALAAVFQAASLVRELAYTGQADPDAQAPLLRSLFSNDAGSIDEVFGRLDGLRPGLRLVTELLHNPGRGPLGMDISRYAVSLMHLERKLRARPDTGRRLIQLIEEAERQRDYFDDLSHEAVTRRLGDIYQQTISRLGPRIIVKGEQAHLQDPATAARIRALLLAGIRAAVLWRQAGGGRLRLLLGRQRLIDAARQLLAGA